MQHVGLSCDVTEESKRASLWPAWCDVSEGGIYSEGNAEIASMKSWEKRLNKRCIPGICTVVSVVSQEKNDYSRGEFNNIWILVD